MSRVWLRMAGTSDATKYSPSPSPITTGGPMRAATILFGSELAITLSANTPVSSFTALANRFFQIALVVLLHQVRDHFGVGLGDELVAFELELVLELQIILDDAVVHHHDVAGAIAMRMRVLFGGTPVRGPARVADAIGPVHRIHADGVFQIAQLARRAANREMIVAVQDCDARPSHTRGIPAGAGHPE